MTALKVLLTIFVITIASFFYAATFTSIPLDIFAGLLNKIEGVQIEGVEGSLMSGFKVKKVNVDSPDSNAKFQLENMEADYSMPRDENGRKVVHIKKLGIDKFYLIGLDDKGSEKSKASHESKTSSKSSSSKDTEKVDLKIDLISIKDVVIKESSGSKGFKMRNFIIENMLISENAFKFERLDIKSNFIDMDGSSSIISKGSSQIDLKGILKTNLIDMLKENLHFDLTAKIINKELSLYASALSKQIEFKLNPNNVGHLSFNNVEFDKFFKAEWPISKINGSFEMPNTKKMKLESLKPIDVSFVSKGTLYQLIPETFIFDTSNDDEINLTFTGVSSNNRKVKFEYIHPKNEESRASLNEL